jgi:UDP-2-acetamido-2,6-beta-L-arabino-hexul-4-ose reductase
MKILVTGAKGFIGKNLVLELKNRGYNNVFEFDTDTKDEMLDEYTKECDFVYHLAGVNRPENPEDFMKGNFGFTSTLLNALVRNGNKSPALITSSIQAAVDNPYGVSKREGEKLIFEYGETYGVRTCVYRLPNVFGKWCRPNYNSAVATFCNNIANGLEITVNDPNVNMQLVYIDDVMEQFLDALKGCEAKEGGFCIIPKMHEVKLGEIVDLLYSFKESRTNLSVPELSYPFAKVLYSTYLSYLPKDQFSYPLKMNVDDRGSFTEIIRTADRGQFSVNISKPGITKGNHWHHTKNEKFVVVSGQGLIQFRKMGTNEVINYYVSGEKIEVVDIPTGYTHNIINEGDTDLVTFMWANEAFNTEKPDTYFEKV